MISLSDAKKIKTQTEKILRNKDFDVRDVIVIGAGASGLSAAIQLIRLGHQVLLLEQRFCGGKLADTELIDNFPGFSAELSGPELGQHMEKQLRESGGSIEWARVTQIQAGDPYKTVVTDTGKLFRCRALILATGSEPKSLKVPGEKEFIGRGVSYSAAVDGSYYLGKQVAVIGGTDTAIREAISLSRFVRQVSVIHEKEYFSAESILMKRAFQIPKIQFYWSTEILSIAGEGRVTNLKIRSLKTDEHSTLYMDGVFIYVGFQPNSDKFKDLVKTDEQGYVLIDEQMQTHTPGIFACGDVTDIKVSHVITAISSGIYVAYYVDRYLVG